MSNAYATENLIVKLNEIIKDRFWNEELAKHFQDYLNRPDFTSMTVNRLIDSVTKLPEIKLRDAVQKFTGETVPNNKRSGVALLNYAKTKGFIPEPRRGTECLYNIVYWFFSVPRNTSHHTFKLFPLPTLLLCVSSANYILDEIDRLSRGTELYNAKIWIEVIPENKISIEVENVYKLGELVDDISLQVALVRPDKSIERIPFTKSGDNWSSSIPIYEYPQGTHQLNISGMSATRSIQVSGGTLLLTLPIDYKKYFRDI